jgi:hypothetical protein
VDTGSLFPSLCIIKADLRELMIISEGVLAFWGQFAIASYLF